MLFDAVQAEVGRCRARAEARRRSGTEEHWPAYQQELRETLRRLLGPMPSPPPLRTRVTGTLVRAGYRVERLLFDSRPDFPVTANLYIPAGGTGPFPGVLFFCGATVEGKAHPSYQAVCQALVRKGCVVLIHDSVGQGERGMYRDPRTGVETVPLGPEQMALDTARCTLLGENLAGWCVWDGLRALEQLLTLPEVDPARLAAVGDMGGGRLALYLAAIDERVRVVVAACPMSGAGDRLRARLAPDPRELLVPALCEGLDDWELLAAVAPRPVLVTVVSEEAAFSPEAGRAAQSASDPKSASSLGLGTRRTHAALRALYERLGAPEAVGLAQVIAPAGFARPLREAVYGWLLRWLVADRKGSTFCTAPEGPVLEPEVEVEGERDLWATANGQVLASVGGQTIFQILCASVAARTCWPTPGAQPDEQREHPDLTGRTTEAGPGASWAGGTDPSLPEAVAVWFAEETRATLRARSGVVEPQVEVVEKEAVSPGAATVRFRSEPGVEIAGTLLLPQEPPKRVVLWVAGEGREAASEAIRAAARVAAVFAIDPRGIGESDPSGVAARFALLAGRPVLGMQLTDVLAAVRLLKQWPETRELPLLARGSGPGGVLALMAGALTQQIDAVETEGALLSYRAFFRHPHPMLGEREEGHLPRSTPVAKKSAFTPSLLLPGVLPACDLPAIAGAIAPRGFVLRSPVDPEGAPVTLEAAAQEYAFTERLYAALGARGRFLIDVPPV